MLLHYINQSLKRGTVALVRRQALFWMMVVMPLLCSWFMLDLMKDGAVERVPVGIVDLDNSSLSRNITRNLSAFKTVDVQYHFRNYQEAADAVQRGLVMGFFYMPADLSQKALSGNQPTISYYINYAYYTPASTMFKGFKTMTVLANGAIVTTVMRTLGVPGPQISAALQPVLTDVHPLNNPWTNYSYYLNASFVPCLLALIILLVTSFSIGTELKYGTSRQWMRASGDSIILAITGKILPQTIIFTAVGWFIQMMMYRIYGMPLNCPPSHMMWAMVLFVLANQGWALFAMCVVPNFRLGATVCTLFGMLSFSFCGFSLPQEALYPWVDAIGYVMPVKYYFLLSIDQALNGIDFYYSRIYYAALIGFALLPWPLMWRLKKECKHPVYVP
ncbi:MAG: ABC transporter permease [Bacteroidales bacterium]|nr:ABC transporter permease [Bacteroidales bacterium]